MSRSSPSRSLVLTVALATGLALSLSAAFTACERHPAGEPALGYGHGSGKRASKDTNMHQLDGKGARFSDSQGTDVASPEEGREGEKGDAASHPGAPAGHENPPKHGTDGAAKKH